MFNLCVTLLLLSSFPSLPVSQDTTLSLWIPCAVLAAFEVGLSVWCFIVGLALRGLAPCGNNYIKEQVCVCVSLCGGGWVCLRGVVVVCVYLNLCLTHRHTLCLTQTHIQLIHTYLLPLGLSYSTSHSQKNIQTL